MVETELAAAAAVATNLKQNLINVTKSVRKKLNKLSKNSKEKKYLSEIKFYRAGEKTKKMFLQELAKQNVFLFTLTVEKHKQKIADSPDNFALLCWILIEDCFLFYPNQIKKFIFDKHFHRVEDQKFFNKKLEKLIGRKIDIEHVNSQQNFEVNTADMVAGSLLWFRTGKNPIFYKLIKERVVSEKVINWKELKRKYLTER